MADVVLIYPYVHREATGRKLWLFPPLGQGFIAAHLRALGHSVRFLDCTFRGIDWAIAEAAAEQPLVVGVYCMVTMHEDALAIVRGLRSSLGDRALLVAGGPMPSGKPQTFLPAFDAVMRGEGELVWEALVACLKDRRPYKQLEGICTLDPTGALTGNTKAPLIPKEVLTRLPMPARDLFDHERYQAYWRSTFGYTQTPVFTARGCPYGCEYCDQPIFGATYREHTVEQVMEDIENALAAGYSHIWFSDDIFMLNWQRALKICDEIHRRGLKFKWDCLGRVDVQRKVFARMAAAGCERIFFGIESGSPRVLRQMGKRFSPQDVRQAIQDANSVGIRAAAFFQIGYPGERTEDILATLQFIPTLPLDYLSFTITYPLPGTKLFDRVVSEGRLSPEEQAEWKRAGHNVLTYKADHSQLKLRSAIYAARARFLAEKHLGWLGKTLGPAITHSASLAIARMA
ncbi:B12-binding domain-containing radical SAM protein [Gloeobacter violaceus]|uniref:Glr1291 protein n=1 Tax=Gloeobacter violaceus (strain ATCC 29082 / PCC 7421) TaxID=251221 RepID=Q7NL35_GLOVI|nr:radical SAM protein [Gloeobacter violaceus]BAC89232.1 glr1291 [Gloeobacter violaceus PCC 7421]